MSVRTFPALGFDPAPGAPAALALAAGEAAAAATTLDAAADAADRLEAGWQGGAADAFRERADDLPRDLRHAAAAHGLLARELAAYAEGMVGRQARAAALEQRAAVLRRAMTEAPVPAGGAGTVPTLTAAAPGVRSVGPRAIGPDDGPTGAAAVAAIELAAVLADARRLRAEHADAAGRAAVRVRAATDPPYREPGVLARLRDEVERWVARHADVLSSVSRGLRGVSAVLGTASLVPGFQFLAPVAVLAGVAAIAVDTAVLVTTGRGSWHTLALDTVLTAVPTGPVARAVRTIPGVAGGLKAANRAVPAGVRGWIFRAARNLPEGITADQLAAAAMRIRSGARDLTGDVVVQGSRAGHSARAGSDV